MYGRGGPHGGSQFESREKKSNSEKCLSSKYSFKLGSAFGGRACRAVSCRRPSESRRSCSGKAPSGHGKPCEQVSIKKNAYFGK
jgi:hypothetical protein